MALFDRLGKGLDIRRDGSFVETLVGGSWNETIVRIGTIKSALQTIF